MLELRPCAVPLNAAESTGSILEQSHKLLARNCFAYACLHCAAYAVGSHASSALKTSCTIIMALRTQNEASKNTANRIRVIASMFSFFPCDRFAYGLIDRYNLFCWQRFCCNQANEMYVNMGYWFKSLSMLQDMFYDFFLISFFVFLPFPLRAGHYTKAQQQWHSQQQHTVQIDVFHSFSPLHLSRARMGCANPKASSIIFPLKLMHSRSEI